LRDIPSALQPRPITAIFLRPYSRAHPWRYSFGLTAAPHHGDIPSALQPRPSMAIFSSALRPCLTAVIDFIRASSQQYQFSLRLTAIIDFSLPHGKNRFHSA
jgi:hypothetical protein